VMCCVFGLWRKGRGWDGLGVFPLDGFRGGGSGLCWEIVVEGGELGGVFEGRGGRASG